MATHGAAPLNDVRNKFVRIVIQRFKSVEWVELELRRLTALIGPPASGKSNILDAIALLGYFTRFKYFDEEYGGADYLEPLPILARFDEPHQLFHNYDLTHNVSLKLTDGEREQSVELFYSGAQPHIRVNGSVAALYLAHTRHVVEEVRRLVSGIAETLIVEARLYSYDRYLLSSPNCHYAKLDDTTILYPCGLAQLVGREGFDAPVNVLGELAWNARRLIKSHPRVVRGLNNEVREGLGERIELKVLRNGSVTLFDHDYEMDLRGVADSIMRVLYYGLALMSAMNYAKLHGLEDRLIVMLEEPETHVFPFLLRLLAEWIREVTNVVRVVIATHNPIFASMLLDKVGDAALYYVYRGANGDTRVTEVSIEKLAKELASIEDVLFLSPREVLERFAAK